MIFASVGSMFPFDRLVRAVDDWAAANPAERVFVQIGRGDHVPQHCEWARIVPQDEYRRRLDECALFVAHVGMGSILQALEARKQMLLMPRKASLREHTTDHQIDTAGRFRDTPGLLIVEDEDMVAGQITRLLRDPLQTSAAFAPYAPGAMTARIAAFLSNAGT